MASFSAASVVEALDYDLRPHYDKAGTIPEPADAQIDAFEKSLTKERWRLRKLIPDVPDGDDPDVYQEALEKFEAAQVSAEVLSTWKVQAKMFAALCSNELTEAELLALPRRVRLHFYAWLRKEVLNPEAAAGDGNAQVLNLPSSAAG
jgi:hypothetical protein